MVRVQFCQNKINFFRINIGVCVVNKFARLRALRAFMPYVSSRLTYLRTFAPYAPLRLRALIFTRLNYTPWAPYLLFTRLTHSLYKISY